MRSTLLRWTLAVLLASVGSTACAQFGLRPKVKIENPRVGFRPAGGNERGDGGVPQFVSKAGQWAPLWFNLEMLADESRGMRLEASSYDGDGFKTIINTPILRPRDPNAGEPPRKQGERVEFTELAQSTLVRVGGFAESVRLQIISDDDDRTPLSDPVMLDRLRERPVSTYVILSLGSTIPGLEFPWTKSTPKPEGPYLRDGRVELAKVEAVQEMPDQWFGYDGVDLVVLGTGKADKGFIADLFTGTTAAVDRKRWALFEWVRRGGNLVISVGDRSDEVRASEVLADILPVTVGQATREPRLQSESFGDRNEIIDVRFPQRRPEDSVETFPVATFTPKTGEAAPEVLLKDRAGKRVLVAQSPLGLGRVTAVAFDLDRSPFADYPRRQYFWDWLVRTAGAGRAADVPERAEKVGTTSNANLTAAGPEDGVAAAIRTNVDTFEGVPVISFGWVALFILGYTLLIGPIEYLFLKKVLGRLELTWVTFPLIVLTVSAAAYFTAYAVKGKDLRINKLDVVDVDLRGEGRVYGRTWFTIFSPRIDSYTIGVEPKAEWAVEPPTGPTPVTLVDWFGGTGGTGIGSSSRSYKYQIDPLTDMGRRTGPSNGLERVPIQVWSTKAFTANWSGLPAGELPPVTSDVAQLPAGGVSGNITVNLPLSEVQEAFAVYRGEVYQLDASQVAGLRMRFNTTLPKVENSPFKVDERFYTNDQNADMFGGSAPRRTTSQPMTTEYAPLPMWGALFHQEASAGRDLQNSTLRGLDQSWRIDPSNTDELILLIRLKRVNGIAEDLMTAPDAASPTKLWLKGLPGGSERSPVPGVMQQDTYIRIYVPIMPAGAK